MNKLNITPFRAILLTFLFIGSISIRVFGETPNAVGAKQFAETFSKPTLLDLARGKITQSPELQKRYQSASFKQTPVFVFQNTEKGFAVIAQLNNNLLWLAMLLTENL